MTEKILETARILLNHKGIEYCSFRAIGEHLEISDGHVRYYFKTKEMLLLELFKLMDEEILALSVIKPSSKPISEILSENIFKVFCVMTKYSFLFEESLSTLKKYPKLIAYYKQLQMQRKVLVMSTLLALQKNGVINPQLSEADMEVIFEQFFIISDSWLRCYKIQNDHIPDQKTIFKQSQLAFQLISKNFV